MWLVAFGALSAALLGAVVACAILSVRLRREHDRCCRILRAERQREYAVAFGAIRERIALARAVAEAER